MPKEKIWNIGSRSESPEITVIAKTLGVSIPTANLLYNRGYKTPTDASAFIRLEAELFHDPFLMADMKKAADRIVTAVGKAEMQIRDVLQVWLSEWTVPNFIFSHTQFL